MTRNVNLTTGSIWKSLLAFAWPLMLSNLLQQLYNTADLMIVGAFAGTGAQAGVGATGSLANMLLGFFIGLATGCAVIVAQMYGAEDYDGLYRIVHASYALSLASGVLLTVGGYFLSSPLLELMQTPADVHADATLYLQIFFIGTIPALIYNMGAGILRSVGDSRRPFIILASSAILNILLDLLFVGAFRWGVVGAGWATVLSQIVAAILVTLSLTTSATPYRLYLRDIAFHGHVVERAMRIGIPAGMQGVLISLSNVLIQSIINGYGKEAVAGFAAAVRIDGFVYVVINAVALAVMTFIGQNIGARHYRRAKKGMRQGMVMITVLAVALGGIFLLFSQQFAALFNSDPEVIHYTRRVMLFILSLYWLFGINEVIGGALRGAGRSMVPMVLTLICMCGFRIFWLYVILPLNRSFDFMLVAYPASWVVTFVIYLIYMRVVPWLPDEPDGKALPDQSA